MKYQRIPYEKAENFIEKNDFEAVMPLCNRFALKPKHLQQYADQEVNDVLMRIKNEIKMLNPEQVTKDQLKALINIYYR